MVRKAIVQIALLIGLASPACAGVVVEPCWRQLCAGMQIRDVTRALRDMDFRIDHNRLERLLQRLLPWGGAFDFEQYAFQISASDGDVQVGLGFVRFPSGRKRLYTLTAKRTFQGTETPVAEAISILQSEIGATVGSIGSPETMVWKEWPATQFDSQDRSRLDIRWNYKGGPSEALSPGISGVILTEDHAVTEEGRLAPAAEIDRLRAHGSSVAFSALTDIALEASAAWKAKNADWLADARTGCRLWNNFPQGGNEAVQWNGACDAEGLATGAGIASWSGHYGFLYETDEGVFEGGKLNGKATILIGKDYEEKTRFEGSFKGNLPNGFGTLERDGQTYTGNWINGCLGVGPHSIAFFTHRDSCTPF